MKATRGLGLVVVSLVAGSGACAVTTNDDGLLGSGGTGAGTGGAISGAGGSVVPGAGGYIAPGAGGYIAPGAGGSVVPGAGGSVTPGAGGTTSVAQVDSTFATEGYGTSGAWHGYLFTAVDAASSITPICPSPCYVGAAAKVCASGTLVAGEATYSMIGFNVNQGPEPPNDPATWTTTGTGITVNVSNGAHTPMRIKVTVGTTDYCTDLTTTGGAQTKVWADFKTLCWGTAGTVLPAGSAITSVAVQVPGTAAAATPYNFCLVSLAPN